MGKKLFSPIKQYGTNDEHSQLHESYFDLLRVHSSIKMKELI